MLIAFEGPRTDPTNVGDMLWRIVRASTHNPELGCNEHQGCYDKKVKDLNIAPYNSFLPALLLRLGNLVMMSSAKE